MMWILTVQQMVRGVCVFQDGGKLHLMLGYSASLKVVGLSQAERNTHTQRE